MEHLHNGILCSRKKELLPFATAWMELESIMLSEMSQVVKDKYHMISSFWGFKREWLPNTTGPPGGSHLFIPR